MKTRAQQPPSPSATYSGMTAQRIMGGGYDPTQGNAPANSGNYTNLGNQSLGPAVASSGTSFGPQQPSGPGGYMAPGSNPSASPAPLGLNGMPGITVNPSSAGNLASGLPGYNANPSIGGFNVNTGQPMQQQPMQLQPGMSANPGLSSPWGNTQTPPTSIGSGQPMPMQAKPMPVQATTQPITTGGPDPRANKMAMLLRARGAGG